MNIVDIQILFFLNFAAKKAGEKAEESTEAEPMDEATNGATAV